MAEPTPPPAELRGRTVIVTGGSSGIGRATALRFGAAGASVVIAARHADACEKVAAEIRAAGGRAMAIPADVSVESQVEALVERTVAEFGPLHAAFNNAGAGGAGELHDAPAELFDSVVAVNLRGVFLCMKHELRAMLAAGGGAIVNNSSAAGIVGHVMAPIYAASKHGVIGLTKSAALQYVRRNIRINAVCPGLVGTPLVERAVSTAPGGLDWYIARQPGGKAGEPPDVSEAVLFLCSDAARFITGAAIPVDGGMTAGMF